MVGLNHLPNKHFLWSLYQMDTWQSPTSCKDKKTHRLSADRTVNGRLLLLLRFSSASFFPVGAPAPLFSSPGLTGLPKTLETSADFLSAGVTSLPGAAAWKNFCRADCVFWAVVVHDSEGGAGLTGFATTFTGASSTEDGRGAGFFGLARAAVGGPAGAAGPFLLAGSRLQSSWWALQMKVSGFLPGL